MDADSHIRTLQDAQAQGRAAVVFPPQSGWFTERRVTYLRDLFQMLFFGIAFPYLFFRFFSDPIGTIRVVGRAQVG